MSLLAASGIGSRTEGLSFEEQVVLGMMAEGAAEEREHSGLLSLSAASGAAVEAHRRLDLSEDSGDYNRAESGGDDAVDGGLLNGAPELEELEDHIRIRLLIPKSSLKSGGSGSGSSRKKKKKKKSAAEDMSNVTGAMRGLDLGNGAGDHDGYDAGTNGVSHATGTSSVSASRSASGRKGAKVAGRMLASLFSHESVLENLWYLLEHTQMPISNHLAALLNPEYPAEYVRSLFVGESNDNFAALESQLEGELAVHLALVCKVAAKGKALGDKKPARRRKSGGRSKSPRRRNGGGRAWERVSPAPGSGNRKRGGARSLTPRGRSAGPKRASTPGSNRTSRVERKARQAPHTIGQSELRRNRRKHRFDDILDEVKPRAYQAVMGTSARRFTYLKPVGHDYTNQQGAAGGAGSGVKKPFRRSSVTMMTAAQQQRKAETYQRLVKQPDRVSMMKFA